MLLAHETIQSLDLVAYLYSWYDTAALPVLLMLHSQHTFAPQTLLRVPLIELSFPTEVLIGLRGRLYAGQYISSASSCRRRELGSNNRIYTSLLIRRLDRGLSPDHPPAKRSALEAHTVLRAR